MNPTPVAAPAPTANDFADATSSLVTSALSVFRPQADGAAGAGIDAVAADKWVQTLIVAERQVQYLLAQAVHAAQDAGVEQRFRSGSAHRYLTNRHRLTHTQARDLLAAAKYTGVNRSMEGEYTLCEPETAAAAAAGRIGAGHVAVIAEQLDRLPEAWLPRRATVERALSKLASFNSPQATAGEAKDFIKRLTKGKVTDRDRRKRRGLWLGPQHDDGMSYLQGWLDPTARAYFESMEKVFGQPGLNNVDDVFSPRGTLGGQPVPGAPAGDQPGPAPDGPAPDGPAGTAESAAPKPAATESAASEASAPGPAAPEAAAAESAAPEAGAPEPAASESAADRDAAGTESATPVVSGSVSGRVPGRVPGFGCGVDPEELAAAAERDERSVGQRLHDAFAAACEYAAVTGALGTTFKGLPAQLIVTAGLEQIEQAVGEAVTATGTRMSISEMLTCAERVHPVLVLFDHDGQPMHFGRTRRLASMEQRMALFARDLGCSRPGCHHGAFGAEAHHLLEWARGGLTDVRSMTLACRADHRHINDTSTGLKTWMDPKKGRAAWAGRAPDPNRPGEAPPTIKPDPGDRLAEAIDTDIRERKAKRRRKGNRSGPRSRLHKKHDKPKKT